MKVKLKRFVKAAMAILLIMIAGGLIVYSKMDKLLQHEKELKMEAQQALILSEGKVKYLETTRGKKFARTQVIKASPQTIKALPEAAEIKALVKKINRLEAYINTAFTANGSFSVPVYDTVIRKVVVNDTSYARSSAFSYSDNYLSLNCTVGDSARCDYTYSDSTKTVVHKQPKGKWWQFWEWGKKNINCDVYFSNPNSRVLKNRTVIAKD